MQLQVMNSPFNEEQVELLNRLLPTLNASQKAWLSGYLTAIQSADTATVLEAVPAAAPAANTAQPVSKEVTILFGSQTGNAQGLAENAGKTLKEQGFQ
ncbi:sulfite reductase [NADPH] flavoprotein alpha-component, partial [Halalkalibacterium halodurans]|nr:sulfite reductase [NADPH] flavoprotein alpha-component [Halalkalibacterium halodurans]